MKSLPSDCRTLEVQDSRGQEIVVLCYHLEFRIQRIWRHQDRHLIVIGVHDTRNPNIQSMKKYCITLLKSKLQETIHVWKYWVLDMFHQSRNLNLFLAA